MRRGLSIGAFWGWVAVLAITAADSQRSTPALGPDADPDRFSAARARVHLEEIAASPRPAGSAEGRRVAELLHRRLSELGFESQLQVVEGTPTLVNVFARLPGTQDAGELLLVAHHDSVPRGPGAGDDATAVAAWLEVARALSHGDPLPRTVSFLFTDGEELGRLGARAFCRSGSDLSRIDAVINVEVVGNRGATLLFETAGPNLGLLGAVAKHVERPLGSSLAEFVFGWLPNDSDFTEFRRAGLSGLNLAMVGGSSAYHAPFDTPEAVHDGSLQRLGECLLSLTRGLAVADLDSRNRQAFHDLAGRALIRAPSRWARWSAVLVAVACAFFVVRGASVRESARAFVRVACSILVVAVAGALLQGIADFLARAVPEAVANTRAAGDYLSALFTASGVFLIGAFGARSLGARLSESSRRAYQRGGLLLWCAVVLATSTVSPDAALVLTVPTAAAVLAFSLCASAMRGAGWLQLGLATLAATWLATTWLQLILITSLRPLVMAALAWGTLALGLPLVAAPFWFQTSSLRRIEFLFGLSGVLLLLAGALGRARGW